MSSPNERRTAPFVSIFLGLTAALCLAAGLSACGGAEGDELRNPLLLTENQALRERAEASVAEGLVGAVYASQQASTDKLYLGVAGKAAVGGAALQGSEMFQLASLSKAMTAALLAHWVEQGRLRWDSRPAELLPELAAMQQGAYASVTLAQLLDHRSGLPALNESADLDKLADYLQTRAEAPPATESGRRLWLAQWAMSLAPVAKPGQDFLYSNAGYIVAGAMLEAATGQDFETLMRQWAQARGLQPTWLKPAQAATGYEGASAAQLQPVSEYPPELQPWVDAIKPAGDVWMSPAGYARWLAEHQRALQGRAHQLPPAYVQRLRELKQGDYALGWEGSQINGRKALIHSGADKGFMGLVVLEQDGRSAYFALSNTLGVRADGSSWVLDSLNRGLIQLLSR
ncbi:beta-lactamase family protein [Paucibacter sp. TC2R-5]|uniref:serine hydrolase domain-containing protein n=1 Tax=Paucibacter sp. TC2R-5 TaxID=2893555 RepID=UPI0021E3D7E6|nr:serine hydrolase domain-containing protein [Paucibacter sp. TC2R-5]MCV2360368.1 beta-lactamase family protein [Paucibacter sp. TC2R-5]